jgi:hypothetical protein
MTWWERNHVELTSSDLLVALAVLSLLSAFLYPTLRSRAFTNRVDTTANEVETLSDAALGVLSHKLERGPLLVSQEASRSKYPEHFRPIPCWLEMNTHSNGLGVRSSIRSKLPPQSPSFRRTQMLHRHNGANLRARRASSRGHRGTLPKMSFSRATGGRYRSYRTRCGPSSSQMATR